MQAPSFGQVLACLHWNEEAGESIDRIFCVVRFQKEPLQQPCAGRSPHKYLGMVIVQYVAIGREASVRSALHASRQRQRHPLVVHLQDGA